VIYKTYTGRLICPIDVEVREANVWSVIRGNAHYLDELLRQFSLDNSTYYIHFLDGDNWGEREIWLNGANQDSLLAIELFNIFENKDCVCGYADEFLLLDNVDRTLDIFNILEKKDFTLSTVVFKCNRPLTSWLEIRKQVLNKLYEQKAKRKGCVYNYTLE
jgi:hypothetical protein